MSNKFKDISIKSTHTTFWWCCQCKKFHPNDIKMEEKSYKNIFIYYIGYVTIKDLKYVKIISANSLYLTCSKVNGYFREIKKNKYWLLILQMKEKK